MSLRSRSLIGGEEQACRRAALVRRLYAENGIEEPTDPAERAVCGLSDGPVEDGNGGSNIAAEA